MRSKKCVIYVKNDLVLNDNGIAFSGAALSKKYYKVRDLCHYTGKFRGAAADHIFAI